MITEITLVNKILLATMSCGFGAIWYFFRRLIAQQDNNTNKLSTIKDDSNKAYQEIKDTLARHDKKIAVLAESKVGRADLKAELSTVELKIESRISDLKNDIKEDNKELKEDNKEVKDLLNAILKQK